MRKDHEITVKCRWGSEDAIPTAAGSFRSCGGGSAGKDHEKFLHLEGKQKKPSELFTSNASSTPISFYML